MPLFTSNRERCLWFWALVVMVAIYATLGTAGLLAATLRERNLLRISIAVVLLLAAGVIIWQWAKRHPGRSEIGVAIGVAVAYWWSGIRDQDTNLGGTHPPVRVQHHGCHPLPSTHRARAQWSQGPGTSHPSLLG